MYHIVVLMQVIRLVVYHFLLRASKPKEYLNTKCPPTKKPKETAKKKEQIDKRNARQCRRKSLLWNFKSLLTFFPCR